MFLNHYWSNRLLCLGVYHFSCMNNRRTLVESFFFFSRGGSNANRTSQVGKLLEMYLREHGTRDFSAVSDGGRCLRDTEEEKCIYLSEFSSSESLNYYNQQHTLFCSWHKLASRFVKYEESFTLATLTCEECQVDAQENSAAEAAPSSGRWARVRSLPPLPDHFAVKLIVVQFF